MKTENGNKHEIRQKLKRFLRNDVSCYLFCDKKYDTEEYREMTLGVDDFEMSNYVYFLDHVCSREALIKGLEQLSPFADDALKVAISMSERDFCDFKLALPSERNGGGGGMSERFVGLLLPARFMPAMLLAEKAKAPLGATLIRIWGAELGII